MIRYGLQTIIGSNRIEYQIVDCGENGRVYPPTVVWKREATSAEANSDDELLPADVRAEYERLCRRGEFIDNPTPSEVGLVEMATEDEFQSFDQPCVFGNRCDSHAVYCHNEGWLYAPRKCRRTWYTGGEIRDEDCRGFKPNPNYKKAAPAPGEAQDGG